MEMLTRFERTRLVSARALQLSLGAPLLVSADKELSMKELAKKELDEGAMPLAVLRHYPDGSVKRVEGA